MLVDFDVAVAGGSLRGWRNGSGAAVVVLHGGPGLSDYTGSLAAELVDGYTVHRYQQRGLAPSTTAGPYDVETHVADVLAVLDAVGGDGAYLVGHSWGGHLAMHVATSGHRTVRGLVVVDPLGAVGDGGEADLDHNLGRRLPPPAAARARQLDQAAMAGGGSAAAMSESLALVWPAYFARPWQAPPMPFMTMSVPCYAGTFASARRHLAAGTLERRLPDVRLPTVFVLGASSPVPPVHGTASAALIPGARVEVIEDCGHFPWLERPGVVRAALDAVAAEH